MAEHVAPQQLSEFMSSWRQLVAHTVERLPTHDEYLRTLKPRSAFQDL
ncbi:hypothetical protein [Marinimicrobium sp. ARAG 43.8]